MGLDGRLQAPATTATMTATALRMALEYPYHEERDRSYDDVRPRRRSSDDHESFHCGRGHGSRSLAFALVEKVVLLALHMDVEPAAGSDQLQACGREGPAPPAIAGSPAVRERHTTRRDTRGALVVAQAITGP